ncbi:DUF3576 domain-containing protein [Alphaproteobacteria bacterium]|nr:DUF3576 domain-containing protein [Alphaproteobacteria bacterium]
MFRNLLLITTFFIIAGCANNNSIVSNPITGEKSNPGLFSKNSSKGISLSDLMNPQDSKGINVNVNGYLWRASLDILSIAPLISTDAFGGTIITDWYVNKNIKNQRLKITAYIKTSELRSEGINVKVHIQNFKNNSWSETFTNKNLEIQIENNILNKARNLRLNSNN